MPRTGRQDDAQQQLSLFDPAPGPAVPRTSTPQRVPTLAPAPAVAPAAVASHPPMPHFQHPRAARSIVLTHGDPPARAWFAAQLAEKAPQSHVLDPVPLKSYQV